MSAGSVTTSSISTSQLVVNGNDVTTILEPGGNLNGNSATITGTFKAADVVTNSVGIILASGMLIPDHTSPVSFAINLNSGSNETIATSPTPKTQIGFICATVFDNNKTDYGIGLYTRAKILDNSFYNVFIEKNSGPIILTLNTDNGMLTIGTNSLVNPVSFEIKALNLFEN